MNQFEQYKRLIKLGFALILVALLTGLYGVIWINWYNKIIWAPFFRRGNWMMIFIYGPGDGRGGDGGGVVLSDVCVHNVSSFLQSWMGKAQALLYNSVPVPLPPIT